jgi:RNA-directed DNA polymerase
VIVHCTTQRQARFVLGAITRRMAQLALEVHPAKTRIVYCKDSNRRGSHEHERFDFLGYTFRPRLAINGSGGLFTSFCPAVSDDAAKAIRRQIKRWRLHLRSAHTLTTSQARSTRSCAAGSATTRSAGTGRSGRMRVS